MEAETTYTSMPVYLGGKYIFNINKAISPFVGIAGIIYNVKETNVYVPPAPYNTAYGVSLIAGSYLRIFKNISLFADLRFDIGSLSIEGFDETSNLGGLRFHLGFVYKFSF